MPKIDEGFGIKRITVAQGLNVIVNHLWHVEHATEGQRQTLIIADRLAFREKKIN